MEGLMKKFEYKQMTLVTNGYIHAKIPEKFTNQLNEYGSDGWELIQAVPLAQSFGRTSSVTFIMCREINL